MQSLATSSISSASSANSSVAETGTRDSPEMDNPLTNIIQPGGYIIPNSTLAALPRAQQDAITSIFPPGNLQSSVDPLPIKGLIVTLDSDGNLNITSDSAWNAITTGIGTYAKNFTGCCRDSVSQLIGYRNVISVTQL